MTKKIRDERLTNVYAAVGVAFVCVVIGLPLWWKTTEVYRVSLPYAEMENLADTKIQYVVDLEVISFDDKLGSPHLTEISKHLIDGLGEKTSSPVTAQYRTSVRETTATERGLLTSSLSVTDFDSKLSAQFPARPNHYYICLLPTSSQLEVERTILGLQRNVYMKQGDKDVASFSADIVSVVRTMVVREAKVVKGYNSAQGRRDRKPDKESMRAVRSNPDYDVTFTLVSPRPDLMDVQWDIEYGVDAYLSPLVKKLEDYTTITVNSQVLFFTKLLSKPKQEWQSRPEHYYFTVKDLPLMINPLDAKLVSPASTNPELNFLVYVPPKNQYPLYIRDEQDKNIASNSFLSPQWGGIYIYNVPPPTSNDTLPTRPDLDMKRVMEVFVSQIRLLLDLHAHVTSDIQLLPVGNAIVTEWELDSWLRSRCVENIATATASLKSLAQLLEHISNIVINDDIGQEVEVAVDAIIKSQQLLLEGSLVEAFQTSKNAMIASEKAFFDPSLLELLYFPEDQKFAIYIPLFLPISFPVIASLWQSFKWYKEYRQKTKLD